MKTAIAVLLLVCASMFAAGNEEKDVLAAIDVWKAAALRGDAVALGKLYHDGLVYTHSNGMTQNKTAVVAAQTAANGIYKGVQMRDVSVQVHGGTAIVLYKLDLTHFAGDTARLHEIMVWIQSGEGWQMIARHATRLPVTAP